MLACCILLMELKSASSDYSTIGQCTTERITTMTRRAIVFAALLAFAATQVFALKINREELRDRIYGCWMGKNIGGTLGGPYEGRQEIQDVKGYITPAGEPMPNDDLDLQLVWLKAFQEHGPRGLNSHVLGEYWLDFVPPDWNEYGICKSNMRAGLLPPLSGTYRNHWKNSNGAWIRSEIWACLAPGCPDLAIRYAFEDASVDHGVSEGTFAELFTASVESAAFVTTDPAELLQIGLSHIPPDCRVARSVKLAMDSHAKGLEWRKARELIVEDSRDLGWFQAPANVAFFVVGWLYGDGDFGKSLQIAIGCGDDTDCTGATLGSIFGIIGGRKTIPEEWTKPIGDRIMTVAVNRGGFAVPGTLTDLTDQVMRQVPVSLTSFRAPVEIIDGPTTVTDADRLRLQDNAYAKDLWGRSPYAIVEDFTHMSVTLDYGKEPNLKRGEPFRVLVKVRNFMPDQSNYDMRWNLPKGWSVEPAPVAHIAVNNGEAFARFEITADEIESATTRGVLEVTCPGRPTAGLVPVVFFSSAE